MNNKEVCKAFSYKEKATGSNLMSTGDKLFSYSTCIAEWDGAYLILNKTKYSTTTSKHQTYLYRAIHHTMLDMYIKEVDDVARGTSSLKQFINER